MYRLMKKMNLPKMSMVKPPKADPNLKENGICSNLLALQFDQKAPNLVWVCDFTYVRVGKRFYYICAILDLYARKVIACRVRSKIDRFLTIDTLHDAVQYRGASKGVMFHTDRGSQSTSSDFHKELDKLHSKTQQNRTGTQLFEKKFSLVSIKAHHLSCENRPNTGVLLFVARSFPHFCRKLRFFCFSVGKDRTDQRTTSRK